MGKSIDSARVAPSGTTRARRGTLFVVWTNFWTAFSSLNPPLLHYSKNRWENKFLGLGDGRINENISTSSVQNTYKYITLKFLPSRPSSKTRRNKKKTHISENSTFSSYFYLSSGCCTTTFDGRLWVLFLFPILAEPACWPGGLSSRAWMPHPKMPERVPREVDLFSSYPCPQQQTQQRIKNLDSRHGFGRLGSRWPRQARRGGWKTREDGSECRATFPAVA